MQWGHINGGSYGTYTVNFPRSFPNRCFSVTASSHRNSYGANGSGFVSSISTTGCVVLFDGSGYWIAVGY
jgi:hypothetical protein